VSAGLAVREVIPDSGETADLATDAGRSWLAQRYARSGAYVRLNMITSLTGGAVGADGTSESLTSRVDRTILGTIRRLADVVVVGAQTVRAEGMRRPRDGVLAVVTRRGLAAADARGLAPSEGRDGRVLIVCPADVADTFVRDAAALGAELVPVVDTSSSAILAALADRGLSRVVCEGGPAVASQFVGEGAVDELCVTVAPVVGAPPPGGPFLRLPVDVVPRTSPTGMLVDAAGFSYLRLSVSP